MLINRVKKKCFYFHYQSYSSQFSGFLSFIDSFILLLPCSLFHLTCLPGKVSIQAGLRRKGDKWVEERGIGSGPRPNENTGELMQRGRRWLTGSLRAAIMRNRGEGKAGEGERSEDKTGGGEKWGSVEWYMRKRTLRQKDRKWGESHKWGNEGGWGWLEIEEERGRRWKMDGRVRVWAQNRWLRN